jgi:hypothetical protein
MACQASTQREANFLPPPEVAYPSRAVVSEGHKRWILLEALAALPKYLLPSRLPLNQKEGGSG